MGLLSFLLSRDAMGHAFSINYKGNGAYPTLCGAILTIAIQVLTLFQLVKLSTEMIEMSEPNIQSYERPLLISETTDYGDLNFYDSFFSVGVVLFSESEVGFIPLPEQVGSW